MSTIRESSSFASTGFALTEQSAVEQVNGLIEVQCRFVTTASRRDSFAAQFYPDSPPPKHPPCVNPAELVTNRLYMRQRSIKQENGLVTIDAQYVGAWQRAGYAGYYMTSERSGPFIGITAYAVAYLAPGEPRLFVKTQPVSRLYWWEYFVNEITVEYTQIGNEASAALPTFAQEDLWVYNKLIEASGTNASLSHTKDVVFGSQLGTLQGTGAGTIVYAPNYSLTVTSAPARPEWLNTYIGPTPIGTEEPTAFITPTVRIKKVRYSL